MALFYTFDVPLPRKPKYHIYTLMKRIVFFSVPAYGHLTAVHPVIAQLVREGNEVTWYCSAKYKGFVESSGARYEEYAIDFESVCNLREATGDLLSLLENLLRLNRQFFLRYEKEDACQSDFILYDSMCSFAKNIAVKHSKPHVCLCTTLAYNSFTFTFSNLFFSSIGLVIRNAGHYLKMIREENRFRKANGISKLDVIDLFMNKGDRTLVFSPKEFQPLAWTFGKDVQFVGTTIKHRTNLDTTTYSDYDIYVSLGTVMTEQKPLLDEIQNSCLVKSRKTIINIGNLDMDRSCENVELVSHTNQMELLKHCRLFINHGGLNGVYESIERGVVQVCIPQQEEQRMNAIIVQNKGLGLYMSRFDEGRIMRLLQDLPEYQKRVSAFGEIIRKYDGTANAVNIINSML